MFKPTKKQHLVNKNYADKNSGSGGGTELLIVNINGDDTSGYALDRTWQEIHDAFPNVILRKVSSGIGEETKLYSVINVREEEGLDERTYTVDSFQSSTAGFTIYSTKDPNGYPNMSGGGIH